MARHTSRIRTRWTRGCAIFAISVALFVTMDCSSTSPTHLAFISLRDANAVAVYRVNDNSANFTSIVGSPFTAGLSPSSVYGHPSKKFVYVANQTENDISLFKVNSQSGGLTEILPRTATGIFPASLGMDSAGSFLFVANQASNSISVFSIDSGNGTLTEISGSPFATPASPIKLKVSPSGKFLYVLDPTLATIDAYAITSGSLQPIGSFAAGPTPSSFAIDPGEHFLYVTNSSTSNVSAFAINSGTGALTVIPGSPFSTTTTAATTTPVDVVVGPMSQYLYVLNSAVDEISEYSISGFGIPTLLTASPATLTGTGPAFLVFDSTEDFVFVGNQGSGTVAVLSVGTDGTLTAGTSAGATVGASLSSMFVFP